MAATLPLLERIRAFAHDVHAPIANFSDGFSARKCEANDRIGGERAAVSSDALRTPMACTVDDAGRLCVGKVMDSRAQGGRGCAALIGSCGRDGRARRCHGFSQTVTPASTQRGRIDGSMASREDLLRAKVLLGSATRALMTRIWSTQCGSGSACGSITGSGS